jgi:hypothetical protein
MKRALAFRVGRPGTCPSFARAGRSRPDARDPAPTLARPVKPRCRHFGANFGLCRRNSPLFPAGLQLRRTGDRAQRRHGGRPPRLRQLHRGGLPEPRGHGLHPGLPPGGRRPADPRSGAPGLRGRHRRLGDRPSRWRPRHLGGRHRPQRARPLPPRCPHGAGLSPRQQPRPGGRGSLPEGHPGRPGPLGREQGLRRPAGPRRRSIPVRRHLLLRRGAPRAPR